MTVIGTQAIGAVGGVALSAAPLLSVLWFPVDERTTATAAATMFGYVGTGLGFITGNCIVFIRILVKRLLCTELLSSMYRIVQSLALMAKLSEPGLEYRL